MTWLILAVAGLLEVGWTIGLEHTAGFTRLVPIEATRRSRAINAP